MEMVELIPGKKYKIISLDREDSYSLNDVADEIVGKIFEFKKDNTYSMEFDHAILWKGDGFKVEEVQELPPPAAEAYTMPEIHTAAGFPKGIKDTTYKVIARDDESGQAILGPNTTPRQFESGAVRDSNIGKPFVHDLLGYTRLRFGYHMSKNALRYGDGNFKKGIPTDVALESLDRHLAQYISGERDYDHLSAILFNLQLVMMNEEKEGIKPDHYAKS